MQKALEEAVSNSKDLEKDVLSFLKGNFLDRRGLIVSEIHNDIPTDYCLLESIGQLMEYAVVTRNLNLFDTTWRITKRYFLSPRGYLYWRINRRTLAEDDATSLLDSLRVSYSLIKAYEVFKEERYLRDGIYIGENIIKFNSHGSYLVDYFDGRVEKSSKRISLFYLNLEMISKLSQYIDRFKIFYESSKEILEKALESSKIFFPDYYDISSSRYHIPSKVNMIEQIYIAINIGNYNLIEPFIDFIDTKIREEGKIYTSYYWDGKTATLDESYGVYAVLSLFLLNRKENYDILLEKINVAKLGDYKVKDLYVFDQLELLILLAKR
ncbi:MAG: hypothetical protein N2380_02595 [bacterium]|nr:hypothetical protein [bacterium]